MIELVNGHVLFPHFANFSESPEWERHWENEVEGAEFGHESRYALRSSPRVSLQWKVTPSDLQDDAQLLDRIMAAKKSGLACVPQWGRGILLAAEAGDTSATIAATLWQWSVVPYIFFVDAAGEHDVCQVQAIFGGVVTLASPLSRSYPAGSLVWPMLFGKFYCQGLEAFKSEIGEATLSITEIQSPYLVGVGSADAPIDGIGGWIIGDTFIVQ